METVKASLSKSGDKSAASPAETTTTAVTEEALFAPGTRVRFQWHKREYGWFRGVVEKSYRVYNNRQYTIMMEDGEKASYVAERVSRICLVDPILLHVISKSPL